MPEKRTVTLNEQGLTIVGEQRTVNFNVKGGMSCISFIPNNGGVKRESVGWGEKHGHEDIAYTAGH